LKALLVFGAVKYIAAIKPFLQLKNRLFVIFSHWLFSP